MTITGTVDQNAIAALSNTATADSATPDPDTSNDSDTELTQLTPFASLRLVKTHSPGAPRAGAQITYTLDLTNDGPSAATDVEIDDTVPAGLTVTSVTPAADCNVSDHHIHCDFGTVPSGGTRQVTIVADIDPTFSGTLHNEARATTNTPSNGPVIATDDATVVTRGRSVAAQDRQPEHA